MLTWNRPVLKIEVWCKSTLNFDDAFKVFINYLKYLVIIQTVFGSTVYLEECLKSNWFNQQFWRIF